MGQKKKGKHKSAKMWALWNYGRLMGVEVTRKRCRDYANELVVTGGKAETDKMFRSGAFTATKVVVREI